MDRAEITETLRAASEIIDEVLPWEMIPRNRSMAERAELRKAALPLVFSALLHGTLPVQRHVAAVPVTENEDQEMVTPLQAAKMLGVKTGGSVIEWAVRGLIPGTQTPGGRWRFRRADIERFQESDEMYSGLPRRGSVRIEDIVRMKETEGMSWRQISMKTGMSSGALGSRYRTWKEGQGMKRVTVMHLTTPEVRAGNRELADADVYGWEVRDVPDDGGEHPRGKPCPACSYDAPH